MSHGTANFVGAKLVLTLDAAILTGLRDDFDHIPYPAHWDLPGGGREADETPIECALRELYEEFGLTLAPDRLRPHIFPSLQFPGQMSWVFAGTITAGEVAAIRFGDEGQEWRMMPTAEFIAHPRAVPHFRTWVRTILQG